MYSSFNIGLFLGKTQEHMDNDASCYVNLKIEKYSLQYKENPGRFLSVMFLMFLRNILGPL